MEVDAEERKSCCATCFTKMLVKRGVGGMLDVAEVLCDSLLEGSAGLAYVRHSTIFAKDEVDAIFRRTRDAGGDGESNTCTRH